MLKFINGTNTTVTVADTAGETTVAINASGGGAVSSVTGGDDVTASPTTGAVVLGRKAMDGSTATESSGAYIFLPAGYHTAFQTTTVSVANQVRFFRFYQPSKLVVNKIVTYVNTAVAANASVGIYNADGTSLLGDTGVFSLSPIGVRVLPAGSLNLTLSPGYYILAWTSSTATALNGFLSVSNVNGNQFTLLNGGTAQVGTAANPSVAAVLPATLGVLSSGIFHILMAKLQN